MRWITRGAAGHNMQSLFATAGVPFMSAWAAVSLWLVVRQHGGVVFVWVYALVIFLGSGMALYCLMEVKHLRKHDYGGQRSWESLIVYGTLGVFGMAGTLVVIAFTARVAQVELLHHGWWLGVSEWVVLYLVSCLQTTACALGLADFNPIFVWEVFFHPQLIKRMVCRGCLQIWGNRWQTLVFVMGGGAALACLAWPVQLLIPR